MNRPLSFAPLLAALLLSCVRSEIQAADLRPASNKVGTTTAASGDGPTAGADFPIWVELEKPQLVTVKIEDAQGVTVRNLVAEMPLPAGRNRLSWDGYNDGVHNEAGDLVRQRAAPGTYTARGLTHDGIKLVYEFTAYSGGNPPWPTKEKTGGWLADHSCPLGAVFIPAKSGSPYGDGASQVLLTALIAEAGSPLVWVGLDGQTLQRNKSLWGWDGAIAGARDAGKAADPDHYAYLVMASEKKISIRGLKVDGNGSTIVTFTPIKPGPGEPRHEGNSLAVHDGLVVFNAVTDDVLVFADVREKKVIGTMPMPKVVGLQFDTTGRLLVISEGKVVRYQVTRPKTGDDGKPAIPLLEGRTVLIDKGLENPRTLALNPAGNELFVADWGKSNQVKVFTLDGKPLRVIGKPSEGSQVGLYDEVKMQMPLGLAIDDRNQLWVVEASHLPKRVSVWNGQTGAFVRAHYGPPRYGGGGTIDPTDKRRMFYKDHYGLIEFALDWKTGTSKPRAICVNGWGGGLDLVKAFGIEYGTDAKGGPSRRGFVNERPTHINGRTYFIGSWQASLRGNSPGDTWMLDENHVAWPVARVGGNGFSWPPQLNQALVSSRPKGDYDQLLVAWSDLNGNHKVEAEEYSFRNLPGTWTDEKGEQRPTNGYVQEIVYPDLSMTANWGLHVPAPTFDAKGIPIYDLTKAEILLPPDPMFRFTEQDPHWGSPVLRVDDGWIVTGFTGWRDRKKMWQYPVNPGRGAPTRGGEIVLPTRLLGPPAKAKSGEAGYWFGVNGEKGNMFLMTSDGLFLQTLGGDMANTPLIRFPKAERGMVIDEPGKHISFEDEHFNPTITQTDQGEIYLVAGKEHSSIFRVDGFASVKRRAFNPITLDAATLAKLPETSTKLARKQSFDRLPVEMGGAEPVVDGKVNEYSIWAPIEAGRKSSIRIGAKHLYAAWRTGDPACLANDGGDYKFLFKRGGCVDLMLETIPPEKREGADPVVGDLRLLITKAKGETKAVLYRAVVPGTAEKDRALFDSPVGSVYFDAVVDVSAQVKLAQIGGDVEISIPLEVLGLKPVLGQEVRADLGILRGDGAQTIQRLYWNNTDTMIVSDIPSEARLTPAKWGALRFMAPVQITIPAPAKTPDSTKPGLQFGYHLGSWDKLPDFKTLKPVATGVKTRLELNKLTKENKADFAVEFTGFIRIPQDGVWTFTLTSDGGSRIWIGDALVVDNDGFHKKQTVTSGARIPAGLYPFRVAFHQHKNPHSEFQVRWSGPGTPEQEIHPSALLHTPNPTPTPAP